MRYCCLALQFHHHRAGIAPVRDGIGIGIFRGRVPCPIGLVHSCEHIVGHQRDDRHFANNEFGVITTKLDSPLSSNEILRTSSMILSSSGFAPTLPVARRLHLAWGCDELRMPAVEEKRQIRMAAVSLDAPGNQSLEIASDASVQHRGALGDFSLRIDTELTPLLDDHGSGSGQDWTAFALDHQLDRERLAVGRVPSIAAFRVAGLLQELVAACGFGFHQP